MFLIVILLLVLLILKLHCRNLLCFFTFGYLKINNDVYWWKYKDLKYEFLSVNLTVNVLTLKLL